MVLVGWLSSAQVLCLKWMSNLDFTDNLNFFEVFSGEGAVSRVWYLGIFEGVHT